jgi:hypothetical protein
MSATLHNQSTKDFDLSQLEDLVRHSKDELTETDLFAMMPPQPDCSICFLPMPLDNADSCFAPCCGKTFCRGCNYKIIMTSRAEAAAQNIDRRDIVDLCSYCRHPSYSNVEDQFQSIDILMQRGIPSAYMHMGDVFRKGIFGKQSCKKTSIEMYIQAARLGECEAYGVLSKLYDNDCDQPKRRELLEIGAKLGSVTSRHTLAAIERHLGNTELAFKHYTVAARAGSNYAVKQILNLYRDMFDNDMRDLMKDDLGQTLRAFQSSCGEMNSKSRKEEKEARNFDY